MGETTQRLPYGYIYVVFYTKKLLTPKRNFRVTAQSQLQIPHVDLLWQSRGIFPNLNFHDFSRSFGVKDFSGTNSQTTHVQHNVGETIV